MKEKGVTNVKQKSQETERKMSEPEIGSAETSAMFAGTDAAVIYQDLAVVE